MNYISGTLSVFKKELRSYFNSPMAYIIMGLFMFMSSIIFFVVNLQRSVASVSWMFSEFIYALILIVFSSILTMRIYSEDRKNGTEVLLLTSPTRISSIVIGKFLAVYTVFLSMIILTLSFPLVIVLFKGQLTSEMIAGYITFALFGAALVSIGVFFSTLTENQIIAAILSFISMLFLCIVDLFSTFFGGVASKAIEWLSIFARFSDMSNGILRLNTIVYFISFTILMITFSVLVIEKRRWSQG